MIRPTIKSIRTVKSVARSSLCILPPVICNVPSIDVGIKSVRTEDVQAAIEDRKRLSFGRELIPKHNIVANPDDPWWVDGGVTQNFRYPVVIKEPFEFVQVNAEFQYYKDKQGKK
jgi:hypothetical protein